MTDVAGLHRRAAELEALSASVRGELDDVLRELATEGSHDDSFAMRFAQRMMDERDAARRRIAELESLLSEAEVGVPADVVMAIADAAKMRQVIQTIINEPTMTRDRVQSRLLLVNEAVRDHVYQTP